MTRRAGQGKRGAARAGNGGGRIDVRFTSESGFFSIATPCSGSSLAIGACPPLPVLPSRTLANSVFASAVTAWEIADKFRLGKWPEAGDLVRDLPGIMADQRFDPVPISIAHARHGGLPRNAHRDPFDRMLAAQAAIEDMPLVTADPAFRDFSEVRVLW